MTEHREEVMGEVSFTPFVFEPHNGYGAKDPDSEPWPFGYISEGYGRPLFELRPVVVHPYEKLHDAALKMTAAPDLYEALKDCLSWHDFADDLHKPIEVRAAYMRARAALSKATQKGEG